MKNATLLFLVKRKDGAIAEVCLAMKKRGFGAGRYNGAGGKVEAGESIEDATVREVEEEFGVKVTEMKKCAEIAFSFALKPEWNQLVHVYLSESWEGEPIESEEMAPAWVLVGDIKYDSMWPDDKIWLPHVLLDKYVTGAFTFGENDSILSQEIKVS